MSAPSDPQPWGRVTGWSVSDLDPAWIDAVLADGPPDLPPDAQVLREEIDMLRAMNTRQHQTITSLEAALRAAATEQTRFATEVGRQSRVLAEARAHVEEHRKDAEAWRARANRRAAVLRALHGALMEEDGICPGLDSHPEHSPPCCVRAPRPEPLDLGFD